jgi:5-methylcytosine-specific restriction enzyme A
MKSMRPCPVPGCPELTRGGRCAKHRTEQARAWDEERGSSNKRGYTGRWQHYRALWLRKHPLCGDRLNARSGEHSRCRSEGRAVAATDVDHIVPHRGDQGRFWDPTNHQSLCRTCHSVKSHGERQGVGRILGGWRP